jgi:hypothetical protein
MTKRERYIAIATVSVVGLLGLDYAIVSPLFQRRADAADQAVARGKEWARADKLIHVESKRAGRRWAELSAGALKRDASASESQVLNNLSEWANRAGVAQFSYKPERTEREKEFMRFTVRATGAGRMEQIGNFLYRIQTAPFPVRITDLTVTSRKEGTDELSIQLGISTIYMAPSTDADKTNADNKPANASASLEAYR